MEGAMPPHTYGNQQGMVFAVAQSNASATTGMVLGIIAMVFSIMAPFFFLICCVFSIPLAFLGIIFSHIGYFNAKKTGVGKRQAIAGLILIGHNFYWGLYQSYLVYILNFSLELESTRI
jgi:hypothetical protein